MIKLCLSLIFVVGEVPETQAALQCQDLFKKEVSNDEIWNLALPISPPPVLHSNQVSRSFLRAALSGFPDAVRLDTNRILEFFNRKKENTNDSELPILRNQLQTRVQALQHAEAWALANGWNPSHARSVEILSEDFVRGANDSWLAQKDHSIPPSLIFQNPFFAYRQGWFNVVVHGSGSAFVVNSRIVTTDAMAQEIKKRNHNNEPISLLSCRAGTCTLAQDLANTLNVPVVGSSQTIETTYSSFQLIHGAEPNYHQLDGQWDVYLPQRASATRAQ